MRCWARCRISSSWLPAQYGLTAPIYRPWPAKRRMKEIAASRFDVIALSLPRGLGFGDNPPIGAWLSDDEASCGALTQNRQSGAYGFLVMRRRVDDVWCVLRSEDGSLAKGSGDGGHPRSA